MLYAEDVGGPGLAPTKGKITKNGIILCFKKIAVR
jgi:hypothetical protein